MKIECVKDYLQKFVSKAEKISGKNQPLPILSSILFSVKNNQLKIKSTNLDLGVEFSVPVKVIEDGDVAIPASLINNYLSNVQTKNIKIESEGGVVVVSSSQGRTTFKTLNSDDFPIIPQVSKDVILNIKNKDFISGIKSVWYAASISSIKPELSSVYIYPYDGKIVFVATDSFRLAEKKISFKGDQEIPSILIPFKNIPEIVRCVDGIEGLIDVAITKNQIAFFAENFYLTSRIVEGVFPDYKQIIPKSFTTEVFLMKEDILNVLHLSNIFSDKFNQISFSAHPKNKLFEVRSKNIDLGESVEKLDADISGEDIDVNFNYRYIIDAFQSINSDNVKFSFSGVQKPLVIKGVSDESFLYLVMPMNR